MRLGTSSPQVPLVSLLESADSAEARQFTSLAGSDPWLAPGSARVLRTSRRTDPSHPSGCLNGPSEPSRYYREASPREAPNVCILKLQAIISIEILFLPDGLKCPYCDFEGSPEEVQIHIEEMVRSTMGDKIAELVHNLGELSRS